ncbi:MAG TPA: hypothetical protein VF665_23810 [Longimicrobium sp.]|uniref:hypothetical protein n=1 Tax=Longimicrobium sp. TaxID=2029185 RepID=UPI002ED94648
MHTIKRLALAAALLLPLAACGGDGGDSGADKDKAGAAKGAEGAPKTGAQAAGQAGAANFAPADTATRKVKDALARHDSAQADSIARADSIAADSIKKAGGPPARRFNAGEDPAFARASGWPVNGPRPLPGAILPDKRIVCYYGNPSSRRMGALGEYPRNEMLSRLQREVQRWTAADPQHPAVPCLHMVSVVAQGDPGPSGHYRNQLRDAVVDSIYQMAQSINGLFIVDVQVGTDDIRNIMPRFENILKNPDVHFAVDPEFYMRGGIVPGRKIGTMHAADINYVSEQLARIVRENRLPPKVLVIHRFTRNMVTNTEDIILRPEVQIVIDMDGWGAPWLKRDSYRDYVVRHPVQFTGFKLFYHNDTKKGDPLMSPADLLRLEPKPLYIQYQ